MSNEMMIRPNDNSQNALASSVQLATDADKARVARAVNAAGSLAKEIAEGEPFDVCDIFQTPGIRRSRIEGQPDAPCTNTFFLLTDGRALMSQSDGIASSVRFLLSDFMFPDCGRSTERGCLTLCIVSQVLNNGNTRKSVVPVD